VGRVRGEYKLPESAIRLKLEAEGAGYQSVEAYIVAGGKKADAKRQTGLMGILQAHEDRMLGVDVTEGRKADAKRQTVWMVIFQSWEDRRLRVNATKGSEVKNPGSEATEVKENATETIEAIEVKEDSSDAIEVKEYYSEDIEVKEDGSEGSSEYASAVSTLSSPPSEYFSARSNSNSP